MAKFVIRKNVSGGVLVGGCEISFLGTPAGDTLGFQVETPRAVDWKASLP
jgi:hypothetical protein